MLVNNQVSLSPEEQKIALWVAKQRYASNRSAGVVNARVGDQSDELTDLEGFAGEMAFCKLLNLYPDMSIEPQTGTFDCETAKGTTIDVKTTKYERGHLIVGKKKEGCGTQVYALMVGSFPQYQFRGWVYNEDIFREEWWNEDHYKMPQSALRQELFNI